MRLVTAIVWRIWVFKRFSVSEVRLGFMSWGAAGD